MDTSDVGAFMTPRQFLEKVIAKFGKELAYYTHPDVQTTAHQVGTPFKDSWTELLCEAKVIKRSESSERYTELERTLSSLYCFELCLTSQNMSMLRGFMEFQQGNLLLTVQ